MDFGKASNDNRKRATGTLDSEISNKMARHQQPFADSGIASVAAKIQERAQQLTREQQLLQTARAEYDYQQELLEKEQLRAAKTHQEFLVRYRNNYGIELEYLKLQDEIVECQNKTSKYVQEKERIEEQLEAEQAQWQADVSNSLIATHKTRRELYIKSLEAAIASRENAKAERQRKLQLLKDEAERFVSERGWVLQQQEQVDSYIQRLSIKEDEGNQKVEDLAEKVRKALQKRSALRASLRKAQQAYQSTNDKAYELEREFMSLSNDGYL